MFAYVPGIEGELYCAHATVVDRHADWTDHREKMTFCSVDWDFSAPLVLKIKPHRSWKTVCIRPKHAAVPYVVEEDTIVVTLHRPQKFSLELDGDMYNNLFVYACLPVAEPEGENVRVFGPGAHDVDMLEIGSDETVYVDGDAVLYGRLQLKGSNIRLCGHGVVCGEKLNHVENRRTMCYLLECCHVRMEGLLLLDSPSWTVTMFHCQDVEVTDVKQICYELNSDGFDLCSCQDIRIRDCFVRNFDDNISIKSWGGSNRNILMEDCILWADCAHSMLIGPESKLEKEDHFCHIMFRNIDVLEQKEYVETFTGVMNIFCTNRASFYDIEWNDIRIERLSNGRMFDLRYVDYYADEIGKSVQDVRIKNVVCEADERYLSRVCGADSEHIMRDIVLENIRLCEKVLTEQDTFVEIGEFVENLVIR